MTQFFPILFSHPQLGDIFRVVRQHGSTSLVLQIPWALIEPHEDQAVKNHQQSLTRLAQRGGLSTNEVLAVLEDRPYLALKDMGLGEANARLAHCVEHWRMLRAPPGEWSRDLIKSAQILLNFWDQYGTKNPDGSLIHSSISAGEDAADFLQELNLGRDTGYAFEINERGRRLMEDDEFAEL